METTNSPQYKDKFYLPVINCTKEKSSFHNTVNLLLRFSEYLIYAFTDEFQICDSLQIDFIFVQYIFFPVQLRLEEGKVKTIRDV